jgi:hypothetical protein
MRHPRCPASATRSWAAATATTTSRASTSWCCFPGTLEMLQALKSRNQRLAVATGKSRRAWTMHCRSPQLGALFDATRTADQTRSKPHPQMLQELMAELGDARAHADDRRHHARPATGRQCRHGRVSREPTARMTRVVLGSRAAVRRPLHATNCTTGCGSMDEPDTMGAERPCARRATWSSAGRPGCGTCWSTVAPARAFALRFDGRVVAYLNRCAHVPTEMDWQPGEFLDMPTALDPVLHPRRQPTSPPTAAAWAAPAVAAG